MTDDMTGLRCWVYRSPRRDEMYLYLRTEDDFTAVPAELLQRFGAPQRVMSLDLHPQRRLAREDVAQVRAELRAKGYYLQLPPRITPDLYYGD